MLTVTMVGASFRDAQTKELIKSMPIGLIVGLEAEPDNAYDANAVRVLYDDVFIGFVPRDSNSALSAALQAGEDITGEVIGFESTIKPIIEIDYEG